MGNETNPISKRFNGMWPIVIFGITVLINLGVAVSTLWVKSGYVSKDEFEAYKTADLQRREASSQSLQGIAVEIGKIGVRLGDNDRQDRKLEELERRLGEQERRPK